jgi:hypothetical protein
MLATILSHGDGAAHQPLRKAGELLSALGRKSDDFQIAEYKLAAAG